MASKAELKRVAVFQPEFLEDLSYWVETERRTAKRLLELVKAILRDLKGLSDLVNDVLMPQTAKLLLMT